MFEILTIGSLTFWIVMLVLSCIIIGSLETEKFAFSAVCVGVVLLCLWKSVTLVSIQIIGIASLCYIIVGGIWSIWRWHFHLENVFNENKDYNSLPERMISPASNKAIITAWIAYWPWSLFWNFTSKLFTNIYDLFVGIYDRQTARVKERFAKMKTDEALDKATKTHSRI